MKNVFRKGLAFMMTAMMVITLLPAASANAAGTLDGAGVGTYAVALEADPVSEVPDDFGTSAADGKVWADKSVVVTEDCFEVTLSALAQEYARTDSSVDFDETPAADVTLILDITKSMAGAIGETAPSGDKYSDSGSGITYYRSDNRAINMIDAVNKTIDTIMEANPNNRIEIVVFTNGGNLSETNMLLLPMNHYRITPNDTNGQYRYSAEGTLSNGMQLSDFAGVGKYLEYVDTWEKYFLWQQKFFEIKTSAGLEYDNGNGYSAFSEKTITYSGSGTNAQRGAVVGIDTAINAVPNQRKSDGDVKRYPYVLFLTDGQSNQGANTWCSDNYVYDTATSSDTNRRIEIAAQMILAAAYKKDQLAERYTTYNGEETDVTFFTLGIGTDVAGSNIPNKETLCMLDPSIITSDTTITLDLMAEEVSQVANNISNSAEKAYVQSFASRDKFIYPSEREGGSGYYVYSATSVAQMLVAFYDLSELVASETNKVSAPIISFFTEQGKTVPCIVVTDYLGKGMELKGAPVINGVAGSEYTTNGLAGTPQTEGTNTRYIFDGIDTNVLYNPNDNTMTWYAYANDLAIIAFADRVKFTSGVYSNPDQLPLIVTYPVGVSESEDLEGRLFTGDYVAAAGSAAAGAKAYAEFAPESDDPYFFDANNSFAKKSFDDEDKTANITKTADYINTTAFIDGTNRIKMMLGNNGDLLPVAKITKDVNLETTVKGTTLTYTIIVKNETAQTLTNIVVRDDVPAELTDVVAKNGGTVNTSGGETTVSWTIPSLEAGSYRQLMMSALIPATATGTEFVNKVYITRIEGYDLADPLPQDDAKTVIEEPTLGDDVARFMGAQYIFDGTIRLRFFYKLQPGSTAVEKGAGLMVAQQMIVDGALVIKQQKIAFDEDNQFVYREEGGTDRYYYFEYTVAAKNMTDDIIITYVDPEDHRTKSYSYNMRRYAEIIFDDEQGVAFDDTTKDTMKAMLNYGAYTQKSLGYRTDYLVNDILSEEDRIIPETKYASETDFFTENFKPNIDGGNDRISFYGCNLSLDEDVTLKLYYSSSDDLTAYKANVNCGRGEVSVAKAPAVYGDDVYVVAIDKIGACQLNDEFTVELNGFTVSKFSPLSYGYYLELQDSYARGNETVANLKNLMYAMVEYNGGMQTYDKIHHEYDENGEEYKTETEDTEQTGTEPGSQGGLIDG